MADQAVLKYLSIDTTFDPCYLSLDSTFKDGNISYLHFYVVGLEDLLYFHHADVVCRNQNISFFDIIVVGMKITPASMLFF